MANFQTHLTVAVCGSGVMASGLLLTELATLQTFIIYCLLGTMGGILPDIDIRHSVPSRLLFTALGLLFASVVTWSQWNQLPHSYLLELCLLLWVVMYVLVRYGLAWLFAQFTIHRGHFHSILAALWFGLLTTSLIYQGFTVTEWFAWSAGLFVTMGYILHLFLDELYSVDLTNKRLKKSFGTALKIMDTRYKMGIFLFLLAISITFLMTPRIDKAWYTVSHAPIYQTLKTKFIGYSHAN